MTTNNGERKKRTFGPGGSQVSDDYWTYNQRIKIPPLRLPPEELDAETFKELIEEQERRGRAIAESRKKNVERLSRKEFLKIHNDPSAPQRRKNLAAKERIINAAEWFQHVGLGVWLSEQMSILRVLDKNRLDARLEGWETWRKLVIEQLKKPYNRILNDDGPERAQAFLDIAWEIIEERKPKDIQPFTKIIRRRVRQLALRMDGTQMRDLSEEMSTIFSTRTPPKDKPKRKRSRKKKRKKGVLPPGKHPLPNTDDDK